MPRGDDKELKTQLRLKSQETQEMKIDGTQELVDRYVLESINWGNLVNQPVKLSPEKLNCLTGCWKWVFRPVMQ